MGRSTREPPPEEPDAGADEALDDDLDPATIAQLAAWFGPPQAQEWHPPEPAEDPRIRTLRERRQRAMAAVDPAFLARLEAKPAEAEALLRLPEPMTLSIERTPLAKLDLGAWKLSMGHDLREHERPEDIADALQERTPQAILRDLHRPEMYWQITLQPQTLDMDIAGERARTRVKEIISTRYTAHRDEMPISGRLAARAMAELHSRLDEPWEHAYVPPEQRRPRSSYLPTAEDLQWFGVVGYDPDL